MRSTIHRLRAQFHQDLKARITPTVDSIDDVSAELQTLAETLSGQTKYLPARDADTEKSLRSDEVGIRLPGNGVGAVAVITYGGANGARGPGDEIR